MSILLQPKNSLMIGQKQKLIIDASQVFLTKSIQLGWLNDYWQAER